ncbi:MAG: outer membrane protein assembly factor BamD [Chlamydiae bacterium]|nr:outer membrane protein assembly factor BamD [Chlamydiota bacterium]
MLKQLVYSLIIFCLFHFHGFAGYAIRDGKLIKQKIVATKSVQEHYSLLLEALEKKDWKELIFQAQIIRKDFSDTPFAQDVYYYLGVAYFNLDELASANKYFTMYLKRQTTPKYFEEAISYKFEIADKFQKGARKHLLGVKVLPKWIPAREEAVEIYDEVISSLPHHDLAARALFGKAYLLLKEEEYPSSIETFQTLIRRFPKHPLAVESFIGIGKVYLYQCENEYPDPDFLDLATINLDKFRENFPGEEKISMAEENLYKMREIYAEHLFETAYFFQRTKKPQAALIYYSKILRTYPDTNIASRAQMQIDTLNKINPHLESNIALPSQEKSDALPSTKESNLALPTQEKEDEAVSQ